MDSDPTNLIVAADGLYYALKPDHPYSRHPAPNNLYQAIALAAPLVYREQGELALVAAAHRIGAPFHDAASLDAAIDSLRDPATNAAIRTELAGVQGRYRWSAAAGRLVDAYEKLLKPRVVARAARRLSSSRASGRLGIGRASGSFVRARASRVPGVRVVKPRWSRLPRVLIYAVLLLDTLRVKQPRGIEAHMLIPTGFVGLLVARRRSGPPRRVRARS